MIRKYEQNLEKLKTSLYGVLEKVWKLQRTTKRAKCMPRSRKLDGLLKILTKFAFVEWCQSDDPPFCSRCYADCQKSPCKIRKDEAVDALKGPSFCKHLQAHNLRKTKLHCRQDPISNRFLMAPK